MWEKGIFKIPVTISNDGQFGWSQVTPSFQLNAIASPVPNSSPLLIIGGCDDRLQLISGSMMTLTKYGRQSIHYQFPRFIGSSDGE